MNTTSPARPRRPKSANGQLARAAQFLRERRTLGFSTTEAIDLGILRLANRICELRKSGWASSSKREPTECLRYFLVSEPTAAAPSSYAQRTSELQAKVLPLFAGASR